MGAPSLPPSLPPLTLYVEPAFYSVAGSSTYCQHSITAELDGHILGEVSRCEVALPKCG